MQTNLNFPSGINAPNNNVNIFPRKKKSTLIRKVLYVIGWIVFSVFCHSVSLIGMGYVNYIESRDRKEPIKKLHDIIHDNVDELTFTFACTEVYMIILNCVTVIVINAHEHHFTLMRRFIVLMSFIYFLRGICLFSTQLSVPHKRDICPIFENFTKLDILKVAINIFTTNGLAINGVKSCGDYMFSGHSIHLTLTSLFLSYYTNLNKLFLVPLWLTTICGYVCIITSYMHYTIDVVIGVFISFYVFVTYHIFIKLNTINNSTRSNTAEKYFVESALRLSAFSNVPAWIFERDSFDFENRVSRIILKLLRIIRNIK